MLAYSCSAEFLDEAFSMSESTTLENLDEFCHTIWMIYKDEYLRVPTQADLTRLLERSERRGFRGMIESLDCMHWQWKNCPTRWQWAFNGKSWKPTIVLEAMADHHTWSWHAFFGVLGAQNDIIVLGSSPLFDALSEGKSPHVKFSINGRQHNMAYFLADGIYPKWATLVQSIRQPLNEAESYFCTKQEVYRKDVERAFGILQARFAIVRQATRGWDPNKLDMIMMACIILHNMIVENERDDYRDGESDDEDSDPYISRRARAKVYEQMTQLPTDPRCGGIPMAEFMMRFRLIRSREANNDVREDLIAHLWNKHGQEM